jgi:putative sterol carrier protein
MADELTIEKLMGLMPTKGTDPAPKLTLTSDAKDYLDIITGKVNAMSAFSAGKLKLKGDLGLAMKLMNFFKLPA